MPTRPFCNYLFLTTGVSSKYNVNMQQLHGETIKSQRPFDLSDQILDIVPLIMRRIRHEMRVRTMAGLSIVQFRALNYVQRHPGVSLKAVAEHLGLTPPTTSKLIQKLVTNNIIERKDAADRRRICLSLTEQGIKALAIARSETGQQLTMALKSLSKDELDNVSTAFQILANVFSQGGTNVDIP
jgi:DNA-binding MarR family transcriptional regulator